MNLVKRPIEKDFYDSWSNMTNNKLGKEVNKYGLIFGTSNSNALKTIKERVKSMLERRIKILKNEENNNKNIVTINYNSLNIYQLKEISKDIVFTTNHKSKIKKNIKE